MRVHEGPWGVSRSTELCLNIEWTPTSSFCTSNRLEHVHLLLIELEHPIFGFKRSNFKNIKAFSKTNSFCPKAPLTDHLLIWLHLFMSFFVRKSAKSLTSHSIYSSQWNWITRHSNLHEIFQKDTFVICEGVASKGYLKGGQVSNARSGS